MTNEIFFFKKIHHTPGVMILAFFLIGLLLCGFTIKTLQTSADVRARTELKIRLGKLQETLSIAPTRNRAMGVVLLLGINEPVVKSAALGVSGLDSPDVLKRLEIARKHFNFEAIYVIDKHGTIVVNNSDTPVTTGKNISFRPYFKAAIIGQETIYLAIGTNSDSRGLFVAAPIHETTETNSAIIGVVAVKLSAEAPLDNLLLDAGGEVLLISPQGVVFAATRKEWQLMLTPPFDEKRVQEIRDLQQFGTRFNNNHPDVLDFNPAQSFIDLDGKRFIAEHAAMNWNDPNGLWLAVLMEDSAIWLTQAKKISVVGVILLFALLVGFYVQHQVSRTRRLNRSLAIENETRVLAQQSIIAAAEERAIVAKVVAELHQAKSFPELAKTFMHHASNFLNVRLGLFYVADVNKKQLRLVGGYGVAVENMGQLVPFGEGLAGQCAIEQKRLFIDSVPANYVHIVSGSGNAAPKTILLHPLILREKLIGVVELASFDVLTDKQEKILTELETIIAINMELIEQQQTLESEFHRQKISEESLRHQTSLLQALIDTIPYPIFYKGTDSRFLGFNCAYEKIFNVNSANLLGKKVLDLDYLPIADRIAYQAEDEKIIAEVGEIKREMLIPFADGKLHKTLYCVSGFRTDHGMPGGLVGIFIDLGNYTGGEKNE